VTKSDLEAKFLNTWDLFRQSLDLPSPEAQVRLNPTSRHVWDFAWPAHRVALEIQGGTWLPGRSAHAGGTGATRDARKNNLAVLNGYVVLYATSDMLKDTQIMDLFQTIAEVLRAKA
jgi:very-short-patch-repair endonuclease